MESLSIHPRYWPTGDGKKKDTSKPHKGGGKLAKKLRRLNQRQMDREHTLKVGAVKNHGAYKAPGSMNEHK